MEDEIILPTEIDGLSVDRMCSETAQLFANYGVDFKGDKKLMLELSDMLFDFLKEKCCITIVENKASFSQIKPH